MSDKKSLRDIYLRKRRSLSKNDVLTWSRLIQQVVIDSPLFRTAESIALYHPINQEVETELLKQTAWEMGKRICLPHWDSTNRSIRFYLIEPKTPLIKTSWGTLEPDPQRQRAQKPEHVDMIVVPGIVFDSQGYRLGYGYGGYDRVLAPASNAAGRVWGLAYEMQVIDSLPHEPHDIPCSRIITEKRQIEVL